jgi:hydroxymethylpyrimidine/phosphomethylpyrimidine kinase
MLRLLSIAGSDSGGGAGIQADLKTFQAFGTFGMTAVTAVTAQNTEGVQGVWPLPSDAVTQQIRAVAEDLGVDGIKIGMLHSAPLIEAVADAIRPLVQTGVPVVLDPVMQAKGGHALLEPSAEAALRDRLMPLATVVTPNLPEAERLAGLPVGDEEAQRAAGIRLLALGARWCLVKGGHAEGDTITDWLLGPETASPYRHPRVPTPHTHGTGCTLSSAIAARLAAGIGVPEAVQAAVEYVAGAIRNAPGLGHGHGPLRHDWRLVGAR